MKHSRNRPGQSAGTADPAPSPAAKTTAPAQALRKPISMHEDVPVWYDCCSCEAEPYWAELADEPDEMPTEAGGEPPHPDTKPT